MTPEPEEQRPLSPSTRRLLAFGFVVTAVVLAVLEANQVHIPPPYYKMFWRWYIPVAGIATIGLVLSVQRWPFRVGAVFVGWVTFLNITTIDHRLAKPEFQKLCAEIAGIKVIERVRLAPDNFDPESGQLFALMYWDSRPHLAELGYKIDTAGIKQITGRWGKYDILSVRLVRISDHAAMAESPHPIWSGGGWPRAAPRRSTCPSLDAISPHDVAAAVFYRTESETTNSPR